MFIPLLLTAATAGTLPVVQQVSAGLVEAKSREAAELQNYTVLRHYVLSTDDGHHSAEMLVRLNYSRPGTKQFTILWERGSNVIQRLVFQRLLEAEVEAARRKEQVTPENYDFRMEGTATVDGHRCYVLGLTPRNQKKHLMRGRAWVDVHDFSVVRLEGAPVETSFWVHAVHIVQENRKEDQFWMPSVVESEASVRLFGHAHLTIQSMDYQINQSQRAADDAEVLRPSVPVE